MGEGVSRTENSSRLSRQGLERQPGLSTTLSIPGTSSLLRQTGMEERWGRALV